MEDDFEEIEYEKNFNKNNKNIVIIILLIILILTIAISTKIVIEKFSNLTIALTEKEEIIESNLKQIQELQNEKNILIQEQQRNEDENNQIQQEKQDLETKKSELEKENKKLNEQIEQLKKTSSKNNTTSNMVVSNLNTQNSTTIQNTYSTIVYVTKTGEKYHKSSCSYLRYSKIQINLSDAKAIGYTPCSRCY